MRSSLNLVFFNDVKDLEQVLNFLYEYKNEINHIVADLSKSR